MNNESELEKLAVSLDQDDDYRVLRRLKKRERFSEDDGAEKLIGVYLDVETTGLSHAIDAIIELAIVRFEFSKSGKVYRVLDIYDCYQDPGAPIPAEITKLTGISDEMVAGKVLDENEVENFLDDVVIVIAHNAKFDRPFVENQFPFFERFIWGCSLDQVPWREIGIESSKLEYIAYKMGFFYTGHSAEIDCLAGIEVLAKILPNIDQTPLALLLTEARKTTFIIWAIDSPFDLKDLLKARGYRFNDGSDKRPKAWYKIIEEEEQDTETQFLSEEIYHRPVKPRIDKISPFLRFSTRS
jgi:DNA polymerase-3 subunit epsilon